MVEIEKVVGVVKSPVGKKFLTGITGLGLFVFIVGHLAGNITLLFGKDAFNAYAHKLESLGPILWLIEIALLAVFVVHITSALSVFIRSKQARTSKYEVYETAGGNSRQTVSSRNMAATGSIILLFMIIHILHFKFGVGSEDVMTDLHGEQVKDLYGRVYSSFKNPLYSFSYVAIMITLGFHLRHGFWSAIQSLGLMNKKYTPLIHNLSAIVAAVLAGGFVILPLSVLFCF